MKYLITFVILLLISCQSELPKNEPITNKDGLKIVSWNIQNLGKSKLKNDTILEYIAKTINPYDIILTNDKKQYCIRGCFILDCDKIISEDRDSKLEQLIELDI